jgi:hypothetical protein
VTLSPGGLLGHFFLDSSPLKLSRTVLHRNGPGDSVFPVNRSSVEFSGTRTNLWVLLVNGGAHVQWWVPPIQWDLLLAYVGQWWGPLLVTMEFD